MTTILIAFVLALLFSLLLTPLARRAGEYFGVMDMPNQRKVHTHPIPRTGGMAIFMSFFIVLPLVYVVDTNIPGVFVLDKQQVFLMIGGVICFLTGLTDDFRKLPARVKLLFQIVAASVAYAGGTRIGGLSFGGLWLQWSIVSYGITVFWFILFINAINLMDGLDGLVGGVTFFTAMMMVVLAMLGERHMVAVLFSILAGGILGFLRYNFNPASIFLGDGGSYFIGYAIAGISILGYVKSQVGSAMLIPLIALGIPVFDTVLSGLRRFITGKKIFGADKGHIHHRLISLGLDTRLAVLSLYAISIGLCMISLFLVNIRDERAAYLLILVGIGGVVFARRLGYFDYISSVRLRSFIRDVTDEVGISRERRSFLNMQIKFSKAGTVEELWGYIVDAIEMLQFDCVMLYMNSLNSREENEKACHYTSAGSNRRKTSMMVSSICLRKKPPEFKWMRNESMYSNPEGACGRCLIRIELPLEVFDCDRQYGCLMLIKDSRLGGLSHYSIKRVEHLRRSVVGALARIEESGRA